jgi:hypothetical protein
MDEEERLIRTKRRLVPNVDFDDTLQTLEFYLDKYQILSNLGWV